MFLILRIIIIKYIFIGTLMFHFFIFDRMTAHLIVLKLLTCNQHKGEEAFWLETISTYALYT